MLFRSLTSHPADDVVPSWSRNGDWIYFSSKRTGDWQVWKMAADGNRPPERVTRQGGFAPQESPDGRFIYYAKGLNVPGIWKISEADGEETGVLTQGREGFWGYWAVTENGIYFLNTEAVPSPAIEFLDLDRKSTRLNSSHSQQSRMPSSA